MNIATAAQGEFTSQGLISDENRPEGWGRRPEYLAHNNPFFLYNLNMERQQVINILHENQSEFQSRGVKSLALFGSVGRDEARPDSDVDILVEFDRPVGLFGLIELQERLEELLGCPVDLGTPDSLKARIRPQVMEDCFYVTPAMG